MKKTGRKLHSLRGLLIQWCPNTGNEKAWGPAQGSLCMHKPWVQFPAHKQNTPKKLQLVIMNEDDVTLPSLQCQYIYDLKSVLRYQDANPSQIKFISAWRFGNMVNV